MDFPEEVKSIGAEAMRAIWQVADHASQEKIAHVTAIFEKKENELKHKQQLTVEHIERLTKEMANLKQASDMLQREHRAVNSELERKQGTLSSAETQIERLEEKITVQDHEIHRLVDLSSRSKEGLEHANKRNEDLIRQARLEQQSLDKLREESIAARTLKESVNAQRKALDDETQTARIAFRKDYAQAAVTTALVDELRATVKKAEQDQRQLKNDIQAAQDKQQVEQSHSLNLERKVATLEAKFIAQESVHKDTIIRLEQENSLSKNEILTLRTRMIKAEGALEREKKAVERLENRLSSLQKIPY